ncbi:hypothetical protein MSATCC33130_0300 [Metamycoplasma salivarium]|nr:hypothetical protein MSATCC33130_0300 [Metamycoplasma salivarium]
MDFTSSDQGLNFTSLYLRKLATNATKKKAIMERNVRANNLVKSFDFVIIYYLFLFEFGYLMNLILI